MRIKLLVGMLVFSSVIHGQNWQEWTQQNKTQRKYLLQQIAALHIYLGYAKQGYAIADKGLKIIGNIKKGDFDLHDEFFTSFRYTKPAITSSEKVVTIIDRQVQIINESRKTIKAIDETDVFTPDEKLQTKKSFENLLTSCIEVIDGLVTLTTSTDLSLKDDERIRRIEAIHRDMESKAAFCFSYSTELGILATQRASEKVEIEYSRKIK